MGASFVKPSPSKRTLSEGLAELGLRDTPSAVLFAVADTVLASLPTSVSVIVNSSIPRFTYGAATSNERVPDMPDYALGCGAPGTVTATSEFGVKPAAEIRTPSRSDSSGPAVT